MKKVVLSILFILAFASSMLAALPTILVNSPTGSDTAASGAGHGTHWLNRGDRRRGYYTLTLDGSPNLSGVATDGSAVIFLADTRAGNRNFG